MRKIYSVLMALATAVMTFTSCSESNDAFFTATEDDYPRILNTDIPEASGGARATLPAITRDNNFVFEVIVTPADYTTVTWFIDGKQVYEGKTIDYSLIAGTYEVDIVATTTKGKSTMRQCSLDVLPLDTDPALAQDAKSLWCQIGTVKTIAVSNFDDVTKMSIAGQQIADFKNNGETITFTVPAIIEGDQKVIVETADGTKYGCGNVYITPEKWVDPGVQEVILFEGGVDINWGESNVNIPTDVFADVPVGTTIKVFYEMVDMSEGYHALRITTPWWGDNPEDQVVPQFDLTADTPNPFEFTYTDANKAIVDERGGMLFVGYGYKLTKVSYEKNVGPKEQTFFEGEAQVAWNEVSIMGAEQVATLSEGQEIHIQFTVLDPIPEGYTQIRMITPGWAFNPEGDERYQFDPAGSMGLEAGKSGEIVKVIDSDFLSNYASGLVLTGNGCVIKKVTVK